MTDFRELAACRGLDPELFFPVGAPGAGPYDRKVAEAKAVCARCPVTAECLAVALATGEVGVWGGLDEAERDALARRPPVVA